MTSFGYNNFIRSSQYSISQHQNNNVSKLSGEEAKKIYLEEFSDAKSSQPSSKQDISIKVCKKNTLNENINDKEIFYSVQNNDITTLTKALEQLPEKVNLQDAYGWSLLMIACQANSIDVVKELLKRGADTSVRDRAGNSALSLIIKNQRTKIAEIFFNYSQEHTNHKLHTKGKKSLNKNDTHFICDICNRQAFPDKDRHLSSTIHNINLSKHNKCKTWYAIPESNKGYQIMLKGGWNQLDGLGPDGSGKKYPIKTIQKLDRQGLGHETKKVRKDSLHENIRNIKTLKLKFREREHNKQKRMEVNFRREFY